MRGFAAFSTGSLYEQFAGRIRKPHWEMAANVLRKARAVLATNPEKASAYVDTALRLPFDEDEGQAPAATEAHLMLHALVTDAIEESDQDDSAWLDAAIDTLRASDAGGQTELRLVLEVVAHDYKLPPAERRRLRSAVAKVEPAPSLFDHGFPAELLKGRIMTILAVCERYDNMLDEYYA